jgi:polyphosphate glucokinase
MNAKTEGAPPVVLAIDVGGSNVKVRRSSSEEIRKTPSGPTMSASGMVEAVREMTADWSFDVISMGFPGAVLFGRIAREPVNMGTGWTTMDYAAEFGKPIRIINDAAMQALGSYEGGRMLFLGFGTGLGTAMIVDGLVDTLELGHMPWRKGRTTEDFVGRRGLKSLGKARWRRAVLKLLDELYGALEPDYIVLGGGNAKLLDDIPPYCRLGANSNAFEGGFRLWMETDELSGLSPELPTP